MELYPLCDSGTDTPTELSPGLDADTSTVWGRDPTAAPTDVNVMDETEHPPLPPLPCTSTVTEPDVVELGAEMTGPGAGPAGEGGGEAGSGDGGEGGSGDGGGGGGDDFGTKSYLLTNFQDRYFVVSVKYGGELSIRDGWSLQSSTARVCRQTSGLLEATNSNCPVAPSPWRIVHSSESSSESSRLEFRNKAVPYGGITHVPLNSELP
jgi:hypothetical protein